MNCKTNHTHNKKTGCLYNPYGPDLHPHHRSTPYPPPDPNNHGNPITTLVPNSLAYTNNADSNSWTVTGSTYKWKVPPLPTDGFYTESYKQDYYKDYNEYNNDNNRLVLTSSPIQVNIENEHVGYPVPVTMKIYPKNSLSKDTKYFQFYVDLYINGKSHKPNTAGIVMLHDNNTGYWYQDAYI